MLMLCTCVFIHRVLPAQVLQYVLLCENAKQLLKRPSPTQRLHLVALRESSFLLALEPATSTEKCDTHPGKQHGLVNMREQERQSSSVSSQVLDNDKFNMNDACARIIDSSANPRRTISLS